MPARTPQERALIARLAAHTRWASEHNRVAATAAARAGLRAKFERAVDPDGTLPPEERARRADHLQRAHMFRMARAAAEKRSRSRRAANPSDAVGGSE